MELDLSKRFVKDEGVGNDGHGHATRLSFVVVRLAEDTRDLRANLTSVRMSTGELLCREPHTFFEFRGKRLDPWRGNSSPMHEHRQVTHTAAYPPLRRQSVGRTTDAASVERVFQILGPIYGISERGPVQASGS